MNDDVRVMRKGTCQSLSGRSDLTYEFGCNDPTKTILFHISSSTGAGHFSDTWIPLDAILQLLDTAKDPFSLSVFRSLYPGQSINNTGFLGAALKKEGLIVCEKRQYIRKDTKAFLTALNKLIKPVKKSPPKKTAKTEQKEEPK
jgi:hypothetical protein